VPAFLAPLVGFALGALLAWMRAAAPRNPASAPAAERRPLALACAFSALVFTPACAYFLVFAPDWSLAYLIDSRRVPSAVDLVLLAIDAVSVPAGFIALTRAPASRSLRALAALLGAPLGIALLAALILAPRLAVDGTYRQVHGGFGTRPAAGGPLGYALLWMNGLLAAGLALTARAILGGPAIQAAPPRQAPAGKRRSSGLGNQRPN
jgi:hypothetical protein